METLEYKGLLDLIVKNEAVLTGEVIKIVVEKPYFNKYSEGAFYAAKIVTETFLRLLKLSVELGDTILLKDQYLWTADMLNSRGIGKMDFVGIFSDFLDTVCQVLESYISDKSDILLYKDFFSALKKEFSEIILG